MSDAYKTVLRLWHKRDKYPTIFDSCWQAMKRAKYRDFAPGNGNRARKRVEMLRDSNPDYPITIHPAYCWKKS